MDRALWENVLAVNLTGAMLLSKHVLPVMRAQKAGSIMHVSSIAAIGSLPIIAYKTSKIALNEFTRWLAIESNHALSGKPRDVIRRERDQSVPMGRMGTPWETANVATFLAADEASYITGAVIPMDGGLHTRIG